MGPFQPNMPKSPSGHTCSTAAVVVAMVAAAAAAEADDDENDDGLSQESTVSTLVDEMSITNLSNDIQAVN